MKRAAERHASPFRECVTSLPANSSPTSCMMLKTYQADSSVKTHKETRKGTMMFLDWTFWWKHIPVVEFLPKFSVFSTGNSVIYEHKSRLDEFWVFGAGEASEETFTPWVLAMPNVGHRKGRLILSRCGVVCVSCCLTCTSFPCWSCMYTWLWVKQGTTQCHQALYIANNARFPSGTRSPCWIVLHSVLSFDENRGRLRSTRTVTETVKWSCTKQEVSETTTWVYLNESRPIIESQNMFSRSPCQFFWLEEFYEVLKRPPKTNNCFMLRP